MRQINVILDLYSGAVCLILIFYFLFGNNRRSKMQRYFLLLCIFNLGMILGDISNWTCEGFARPWYPAALWAGTLAFWLCSSLILLSFTAYLIEYLSPRIRVHPVFWQLSVILCGFHVAGVLLSAWNGMFFTILPENVYQRGELFWLSQLIPFLMYAVDIAIFTVYRHRLPGRDFRVLSSYIILPLVAEAVQMLYYGIALLNTGVALGLLIIFINIQSEQELRLEHQEKELAEARIDIMLSQIQPHFLYNSLTAIRRLCDHDPQQAKDAIRDFALFLRANMDSLKSKAPIPFEQELLHVKSYLALEQQRFQDRLTVSYEIEDQDFSIPPLTMQPVVENAVRHGILKKAEGGTITIRTTRTDTAYVITVTDNGVGFTPGQENHDNRSHIGIENVRERLSALCGGTLEIQSRTGVGTTAIITIPKEVTQ